MVLKVSLSDHDCRSAVYLLCVMIDGKGQLGTQIFSAACLRTKVNRKDWSILLKTR